MEARARTLLSGENLSRFDRMAGKKILGAHALATFRLQTCDERGVTAARYNHSGSVRSKDCPRGAGFRNDFCLPDLQHALSSDGLDEAKCAGPWGKCADFARYNLGGFGPI